MSPKEYQNRLLIEALGMKELQLIKQQVIIATLQFQQPVPNSKQQTETPSSAGSLDDLKELREGGD